MEKIIKQDIFYKTKSLETRTEELLNFTAEMAKTLLTNGAETYRVEETSSYIIRHYSKNELQKEGKKAEIIISPTAIICGIENERGGVIKRIEKRGLNLTKVHLIINLSREIKDKNLSLKEAQKKLNKINKTESYSNKSLNLCAAISCASFNFLLGGGFREMAVTFVISYLLKMLLTKLLNGRTNVFFNTLIGGSFAALLSIIVGLITPLNVNVVIISTIMLLVPGVALVNAFRDILEGHYIAGSSRLMEAIFIAFCLSIGVFIPMSLINFESLSNVYHTLPFTLLGAGIASAGFAYLFGAPKKEISTSGLAGLFGWILLEAFNLIFISAAAVGIFAIIASKKRKAIGSIYLIAGIIPYVPGGGIYRTMLYLVTDDRENAITAGLSAFGAAGSIALGMMVVFSIYNALRKR